TARGAYGSEIDPDGIHGVTAQLARIAGLLWAERRPYLIGSLFVATSIVTALAYPYVIRLIIDEAIQRGQLQRLNQLSLVMVGIVLVEALSTCGRDYCFGLGAERVGLRLRRLVFESLLLQDIQFFDSRDTGEITTRLWTDVPPLEYVLGEELADTLLAVPPIMLATGLLGRRVKMMAADVQRAHADAGASATEVLAGVRTVRAF